LYHEIVPVSAVFYDTVTAVNNHVALQDRSIIIVVIIMHHHLTRKRTCARSVDSCDADKMGISQKLRTRHHPAKHASRPARRRWRPAGKYTQTHTPAVKWRLEWP
jgi:predicted metal-dependent hydrolase